MTELEAYYNKFNEEKRLLRRHGQVEYRTSMKYIHDCLEGHPEAKILDVGAGTGRYSVALAKEGYDVTAVELVKSNLGVLKAKKTTVKAYQGNAMNLKRFQDDTFHVTLVFGPMYHLFTEEDKIQVLKEAQRVTVPGGRILVAYCMNEYGILSYGFKENHIQECLENGRVDGDFHCVGKPEYLYDYVRLEDIDRYNDRAGVKRIKIVSADGPANYMRQTLKAMEKETFECFMRYHLSVCERPELLGAGAHTLDILEKVQKAGDPGASRS